MRPSGFSWNGDDLGGPVQLELRDMMRTACLGCACKRTPVLLSEPCFGERDSRGGEGFSRLGLSVHLSRRGVDILHSMHRSYDR